MNQDQANGRKLFQEIEASKEVIDMMELWLSKAKEAEVVSDHIIVVEPSGGIGYKKILIKNHNPKNIRKLEDIEKYLMNLDAIDSELDEDLENCTNSTRHDD